MPRPIVTFTTDFGLDDAYVAQMKAAVLRHGPDDVRLVDVTHRVPRHDILAGAFAVERAVAGFAEMTAPVVHVGVVDPGVGTDRRLLVVQTRGQLVVCPDNGLITWAWRRWGGRAHALNWTPRAAPSAVFHGRDLIGPVAGQLAGGTPIERVAEPVDPATLTLLDVAPAEPGRNVGRVIHVDSFGNCTTNVPRESLPPRVRQVQVGLHAVGPLRTTYADVAIGQPLALVGSSDLLEIAVRNGSAAAQLGIAVGAIVEVRG
jgi:S-adenosylmethionine hydrolase